MTHPASGFALPTIPPPPAGRHNLGKVPGVGWFRVSKQRLEYRGRITRDPFTRWVATKDGAAAVARTAAGIRFSIFSRNGVARRRLWRSLVSAAASDPVARAIRVEADQYMTHAAAVAYAVSLPRAHIALHRLVVVPRPLLVGRARAALHERMHHIPELAALDDAVRAFFMAQLVTEMDAALDEAAPSIKRPVQAHEEWACVGIGKGVVWLDRFWSGSDATGHVFLYEMPRERLGRRDRKALDAAIDALDAQVRRFSQGERSERLRLAADQGPIRTHPRSAPV